MSDIAERGVALPGGRLRRLLGRLPHEPSVGHFASEDLILDLRSGSSLLLVEPLVTRVSPQLALEGPALLGWNPAIAAPTSQDLTHDLAMRQESEGVDLHRLGAPEIAGTFFSRERKIGRPVGSIGVRVPARDRSVRLETAESLLAKLLPILLPPARAVFGEPFVFPHSLYEYQRDGVEWLRTHRSALLADDMGLGKTVQAIVAIRHKFRTGESVRALVICPKSVQTSWARHFADWAPELEVVLIAGSQDERRAKWQALAQHSAHVGLVTYQSLLRDSDQAKALSYGVLVLDEIQNIKNSEAMQSRAASSLRSDCRWGLTGTPLENRIEDLATIINFIDRAALPKGVVDLRRVKDAARILMLRRRKEEVLKDLPPIVPTIEYVELSPSQQAAYEQAERTGIASLRGQQITIPGVLALITRLKQICNGTREASAKADWLEDHLEVVADEGDKALVFSQYVQSLNDLRERLSRFQPLTYAGGMSTSERDRVVEDFQGDPNHIALLMSLRAGGTGLTLTAANRVVHFDSWWNPAVMSQAAARAHRIGQTKTVFVTTLVAQDTVEERIQRILDEKRDLFEKVVDDLSTEGVARALTEDELFGLFGLERSKPAATGPGAPAIAAQRRPPVSPPVSLGPQPAAFGVVSAATPFRNILQIRRILREMKGTVWWFDPNFSRRALEDIEDEVDLTRVHGVRIMSRGVAPKDLRDFERLVEQLEHAGVAAEWRTCAERIFHDRFLADDTSCFNVPPVNLIYEHNAPYSEISETQRRPPFEDWWAKGSSILGDSPEPG